VYREFGEGFPFEFQGRSLGEFSGHKGCSGRRDNPLRVYVVRNPFEKGDPVEE
jgi:hypothetical protein